MSRTMYYAMPAWIWYIDNRKDVRFVFDAGDLGTPTKRYTVDVTDVTKVDKHRTVTANGRGYTGVGPDLQAGNTRVDTIGALYCTDAFLNTTHASVPADEKYFAVLYDDGRRYHAHHVTVISQNGNLRTFRLTRTGDVYTGDFTNPADFDRHTLNNGLTQVSAPNDVGFLYISPGYGDGANPPIKDPKVPGSAGDVEPAPILPPSPGPKGRTDR